MVLCCSTGSGLVSCAPQGSCLSPREPNAVARQAGISFGGGVLNEEEGVVRFGHIAVKGACAIIARRVHRR